jgi:hypothetical protein
MTSEWRIRFIALTVVLIVIGIAALGLGILASFDSAKTVTSDPFAMDSEPAARMSDTTEAPAPPSAMPQPIRETEQQLEPNSSHSISNPLTGRVIDDRGAPIPNAAVYQGEPPPGLHVDDKSFANLPHVTTGPDGHFEISNPPRALTHLTAYAPGYQVMVRAMPTVEVASANVVLELLPGGVIEGFLIDGSSPAAGNVRLDYIDAAIRISADASAAEGYRFTGLPDGEVELSAAVEADYEKSRQRWMKRVAVVAAGETTRADFHFIDGTAVLQGQISFNGVAAERGFVQVQIHGLYGGETYSGRSEPDGSYRIENLPEGEATIRVTAVPPANVENARQRNRVAQVTIPAGETVVYDVDVNGTAIITGRTAEANVFYPRTVHLLAGEFVLETQADLRGEIFATYLIDSTNVGEGGAFSFEALDAGSYTVVTNWEEDLLLSTVVTVAENGQAKVELLPN